MYSLSATALLKRNSRDAKTNVTGPDPTLSRIGFSEFSRERSSLKYLRLNSGHFPGSWLNHRRSSVEGAASLGQKSIFASCFDRPRGHSRSTRMRQPSDRVGVSYARFSEICTMSQGRILALIAVWTCLCVSTPTITVRASWVCGWSQVYLLGLRPELARVGGQDCDGFRGCSRPLLGHGPSGQLAAVRVDLHDDRQISSH